MSNAFIDPFEDDLVRGNHVGYNSTARDQGCSLRSFCRQSTHPLVVDQMGPHRFEAKHWQILSRQRF